jgi:RNA polymerase sigma-70 factor (ECF subfamily)
LLNDPESPELADESVMLPDKHAEEVELKDAMESALKELAEEQRIVFGLRTAWGLSYHEISEQLDISIGTVMSRLSRAREKLKQLLAPYLTQASLKDDNHVM